MENNLHEIGVKMTIDTKLQTINRVDMDTK